MNKKICFDLDGTLADLYGDEKWLEKLRNYNESVYATATPLVNMSRLAKAIHKAQRNNIEVYVISALSKEPQYDFDMRVIQAKKEWLKKHLPSVEFDKLLFVPYVAIKNDMVADVEHSILFDDEVRHRNAWQGEAYEPAEIFNVLADLCL